MTQRSPRFRPEQLRGAVREEYARFARDPTAPRHFLSGRPLLERIGYPRDWLEGVPEDAVTGFAGVGNPFLAGPLPPGALVVDLGSGAGLDALIAARRVGSRGRVVGIDLTADMLRRADRSARRVEATHLSFVRGLMEAIPLPDAVADVVISNGAINLSPDKRAVYREVYRILRPGGRLQVADVVLGQPLSPAVRDLIHFWTGCVAGGLPTDEYRGVLEGAGFQAVEVLQKHDVFRGAPVERRAASCGALGATLRARKAGDPLG